MAEEQIYPETYPNEDVEDESSTQSSESPKRQTPLIWVTTYPPSTQGANYQQLVLPSAEIQALITDRTGDEYCLHEALEELNATQRRLILNHFSQLGATLLFVDIWKKERVVTVFGKVELAFLIWSTTGSISAPSTQTHDGSEDDPHSDGSELPVEDEDVEVGDREPDHALYNGAKASPVRMHDAWGRKFVFPFKLVRTWKGMHNLIAQAFIHVPNTRAPVDRGHYDLIDTLTGDIILASVWEYFVRPGMEVTLHVWPIFGTPPPPIPQIVAGSERGCRNDSGLDSPLPLAPVASSLSSVDQELSIAKGTTRENDEAKHVRFSTKVDGPPI